MVLEELQDFHQCQERTADKTCLFVQYHVQRERDFSFALLFAKRLCFNNVVQGYKAFQVRKEIQVLQALMFLVLQVTKEPRAIQDPLASQDLRVHLDHRAEMAFLDFQVSFLPVDKNQSWTKTKCSLCLDMSVQRASMFILFT